MKTIYFFFAGCLTLCILFFSFCTGKAANKETKAINSSGIAVVELFTSEGCSSCPPADEVMIRLAKEFPERVYFLGYHVDYWDQIGWKDRFSNPDYTNRQNKYAEVFKLNSIYTPQVIINGEKELVGSRESQLRTIIQQELKAVASPAIELTARKNGNDIISVTYKVSGTSQNMLNIALVQLNASSDVKQGENKGHQLNHINIVREFKTINFNNAANGSVDLHIPSDLLSKDVKVIAFTQAGGNMKVSGATDTLVK